MIPQHLEELALQIEEAETRGENTDTLQQQFAEQYTPLSEQSQAATNPEVQTPIVPTVDDIIGEWNARHPGNSDVLDDEALYAVVVADDLSERERLLTQTLLANLIDKHHFMAGLGIQNLVGRALLHQVANAARGVSKEARKQTLDQLHTAEVVIDGLSTEILTFQVNALQRLHEIQGADPAEIAKQLTTFQKSERKKAAASRRKRQNKIDEVVGSLEITDE